MRRALLAGWFSFEGMGATAGDLIVRDLCRGWLASAGYASDTAVAPPFSDGVDWRSVDPAAYELLVFACGPFGNGWPVTEFLARFSGVRRVGLNLSMLEPLETWNPFDALIERDSSRASNADIAFLGPRSTTPLVGVVLAHQQKEYAGALHEQVEAAIGRLLQGRDLTPVSIDTRLDENQAGLRDQDQVEALIARMDAVVTTRLHGMVLALKNGVPPVVIDPIAGGRKVLTQARTIGWPIVFQADELSDEKLRDALEVCLGSQVRAEVERARTQATASAAAARDSFLQAVANVAGEAG